MAGVPDPEADTHSHMVMVGGVRSPAYPGRTVRDPVRDHIHSPGRARSDETDRIIRSGATGDK